VAPLSLCAFKHADDCKIVKVDPSIEIPWNEVRAGYWEARCVCNVQGWHAPDVDRRTPLDPRDPSTFRHAGECEHRDTTDPALFRALLKVRDGMGLDYWWVECGSCNAARQVAHYVESVGVTRDVGGRRG
jgi:hypothetical protein